MSDTFRKVSRGQVWYIVEKTQYNVPGDSLQSGTRPWLVVSNNACNQNSPVITVVPLTTQEKTPLPTHVSFRINGIQNTVLCEQFRSLPVRLLENATYRWTLSDSVMKQVDEAMAAQLDLSLTFPNSDRFWESLERLVRIKVKQAVEDSRIESVDVLRISSCIDKITDELIDKPAAAPTPVTHAPVEEPPAQAPEKWVPVKKSKRRKWSTQDMVTFLADCEKLPVKEVAAKYGVQVASIYGMKWNFKKTLGEKKEEYYK